MTTNQPDPRDDALTVTGVMGVWRSRWACDYGISVRDEYGVESLGRVSVMSDTEADGFIRALRKSMMRSNFDDRPDGAVTRILCRYNEAADRFEVVVEGDLYEHRIALDRFSWER